MLQRFFHTCDAPPFLQQEQAHFIPSASSDSEGAKARALWPSGQVRLFCTDGRLEKITIFVSDFDDVAVALMTQLCKTS